MNNIEIMCKENRTEFVDLVGRSVVVVDKKWCQFGFVPEGICYDCGEDK